VAAAVSAAAAAASAVVAVVAAAAVAAGGDREEAAMLQLRLLILAAPVVCALAAGPAQAQQKYASPEEAFGALVAAVKADDDRGLATVLGANGLDIVSSGDEVADRSQRQEFLTAYDKRHEIATNDGKSYLVVGDDKFPVPIPLMNKSGAWSFDTVAARQEILYRRIGRNELDTIQTCLAYVDAQNEYADKTKDGVFNVYAQRIISDPGKRNGLYWDASAGEEQSPLGELMAEASGEGYHAGRGQVPYHGYYYRILTRQGETAPGGAMDYIVRGKMIGGFALIAWPAEYGNSGVKTFLVNHEGVVYEKDLGERTNRTASRMRAFNPDQTWAKVTVAETSQ
jgi:hypothetical protein